MTLSLDHFKICFGGGGGSNFLAASFTQLPYTLKQCLCNTDELRKPDRTKVG